MTGYIHSLESLAAVDGDGLRYAVFLSGCPLSCIYCHNPDTQCGKGKPMESCELVKKILRYKPYFKRGGGVTFSGGEPLLQSEFIIDMGDRLRCEGINYAIDTSGAVTLTDNVKRAILGSEQVLLDLKFYNEKDYKLYTGADFSKVLATLSYLEECGKRTTVKTVVVPGINDSERDMDEYARIAKPYSCIEKYELLPFHTMGFFKYESLGVENKLRNTPAMPKERCNELQVYLNGLLEN